MSQDAHDLQYVLSLLCGIELTEIQAVHAVAMLQAERDHRRLIDDCLTVHLAAAQRRAERRF